MSERFYMKDEKEKIANEYEPSNQKRLNIIRYIFFVIILGTLCTLIFANLDTLKNTGIPHDSGDSPRSTRNEILDGESADSGNISEKAKLKIIKSDPVYPEELVEMAVKYDETIDFVYQYPEFKDMSLEIDLSAETQSDTVPLLLQWDQRWGYAPYGEGLIGYNGCGPVSLSMVALYLLDDPEYIPIEVARIAEKNGYYVKNNGSSWTLISEGCRLLGLNAEELPLEESIMKNVLDEGCPIIIVVGPGDFTTSGHYMVVTGYDKTGFIINDPNSLRNSSKTWSYDKLSPQIRNLWAMSNG